MVQFLQRAEDPSVRIGQQLAGIIESGMQGYQQGKQQKQMQAERQNFKEQFGFDLSSDPQLAKVQMAEALKGQRKQKEMEEIMKLMNPQGDSQPDSGLYSPPSDMEGEEDLPPKKFKERALPFTENQINQMTLIDPQRARIMQKKNETIQNQNYREKKLEQEREITEKKLEFQKVNDLRKETTQLRQEIQQKGAAANESIRNKENMLDMIDTGNLDNPTYAAVMDMIPGNLGKRFLSDDTIKYKAALVDDYKDLRNIFQGQTRVKELEILEEKLADIYLTDSQKKAIIKTRIDSLRADVIKAQVAADLERELDEKGTFLGLSQFDQEVQKRAAPLIKSVFDNMIDEQKSILQNAENRKKLPLNVDDPDDVKIIDQILHEAGGNVKKAEEIAKKKGYTW